MRFGNFFIPHSGWKIVLLSFLGAATFWFFSALGKEYTTRIKHPIDFAFDRDSLVLMTPLPEYVELDVTGVGWDLFRQSFWFGSNPIMITPENPAATKFLTRSSIFSIVRDQLSQFQINFLYTDTLYLNIEQKISRKVILDVDSLQVALEENYRITSPITIQPDTAIIYGPVSFIDTVKRQYTIPIPEKDIDRGFDNSIALGLPKGFNISSEPEAVKVTFKVNRFDKLRLTVPLELLHFPEDSFVVADRYEVEVKFVSQRSNRKEFFSDDFKVILDYDMMNKTDSIIPAIVMIYPENAMEVEVEPDTIKVIYRE